MEQIIGKENWKSLLEIRSYLASDWLELCRIHDLARPIELQGSCDEHAFVPLAEDKEDLENFEQSLKYVACLDGRAAGFVGVLDNEVTWLYVIPEDFAKGIGRALLEFALGTINGKAVVYALDGNSRALRLYQSLGFGENHRFESEDNGFPCAVLKLSQ